MATSLLLLAVVMLFATTTSGFPHSLPEEKLTTPQLIKYWGYPAEVHTANTTDGYSLTLHRIPFGRNDTGKQKDRPVIYMQHTLLSSSADWVMNLPNTSLGFVFADHGFDVWLGNVRGNVYSRKHKTLSTKSKEFWDFSIDEHAKHDFPAIINYILKHTNQTQIYYAGHSQGTLMAFGGFDESPELAKKIKVCFLFGPLAKMEEMRQNHKLLIYTAGKFISLLKLFRYREIFPSFHSSRSIIRTTCRWLPYMCRMVISFIGGSDHKYLNQTRLPVYVAHTPAGTSLKNLQHYIQILTSKSFKRYDYGEAENQRRYKSKTPPEYNIGALSMPTIVFSGSEDKMSTPNDVKWITKHLKFLIKHFHLDGYSHMDFVWGKYSGKTLYEEMAFYL